MRPFASATLRLAALVTACATSTAAGGAQARRDSVVPDSAARRLATVQVTETRSALVVGGASALIVNTENLRSLSAPVLDQLLRETPSVNVRQNSRGEMELSVRGSDSRQVAVMLDGVPLTLGWDHRTDPSLIPITGAEEVTIVRGLGSLLGGPNTLGGTISVSQASTLPAVGEARVWGGLGVDAKAAYLASAGASRTTALSGGRLTLRGGFAHRDRDGVALPSGASDPTTHDGLRTNSDLRETDAFASVRWKNAGGRSLGLTVTGFNAERGVPPEEHLAAPRLWRYPYSKRTVAALSGGTGVFGTPMGYATLDLSAGYNVGSQKIEAFSNRNYTTVTSAELGDERTSTARLHATHTLPRGAKLSAALTMADVRYTETLTPAGGVDYRQVLWSSAAEVEVPVGPRTTLAGGAALDKSDTPETGGREPAQPPLDDIGWRAGLVHDVNGTWRVHANASHRSRFPALRELYSGALNRFRPNPELKPESLLGVEAGVTFHRAIGPVPDASFQVTAFNHKLDDAVVRITLTNPTRFMRVNRDRIESTGLEVVSGFVFGTERDRSAWLTVDATIQRIGVFDQTANDAQRHAENNPEVRSAVTLGVPLAMQIRGLASARYTGAQYCLHAETGTELTLNAQTLGDVSVERSFSLVGHGPFRALRALLAIDNAANATVFDQCGLPQPGRTLRMMLTFR